MTGEGSTRVAEVLRTSDALAWLEAEPGGAIAIMVMSAVGCDVEVTPTAEAGERLEGAVARALAAGALRALAWQATGRVARGSPMTIVGASASGRRDARAALALLHDGIRGVAERRDLA